MSQQQHPTSEVAALRQCIELEYKALMRLRTETALVASHAIISQRYHSFDASCEALVQLIGEEAATPIILGISHKEVE